MTTSDGGWSAGRGETAVEADLFLFFFFLSIPLEHTAVQHRVTNATELKISKLKTLYAFSKGVGVPLF
jgi:hypothetical protein